MQTADYFRTIELGDSVVRIATESGQHLTPQILFIREQLVYAYDRLRLEEKGLAFAKVTIMDAEKAGDVRTQVEARLTAALIREKHGLGESCLAELNRVDRLLRGHHLPASQARYFLRKASYHRIFGNPDSLGIYAGWAITVGKGAGNARVTSDALMLYSFAYRHDKESVYKMMREAIKYSKASGHFEQWIDMQFNLSVAMENYGDKEAAQKLNEQVVKELATDSLVSYPDNFMLYAIYDQRAGNLAEQGAYREAFRMQKQAGALERKHFKQQLSQQVREVETKYNFELKDAELREQQAELERQKSQKNSLLRGLLFVVGFMGMLLFQTYRLRRARKSITQQAQALSDANYDLEESLEEQLMLRAELHHRVKNNLQVIISLLNLQENREVDLDTKSTLRSTSERVYSIAAVHELLYPKKKLDHLEFRSYLDKLCEHSAQMWPVDNQPAFAIDVQQYSFNIDTLVPLGVVVSEMLTNSRKNFIRKDDTPVISIRLEKGEDDVFTLRFRDNGPGFPNQHMEERAGGLGSYLIRSMARQLKGKVISYNESGAVTEVSFREKEQPVKKQLTIQNKISTTQNIKLVG